MILAVVICQDTINQVTGTRDISCNDITDGSAESRWIISRCLNALHYLGSNTIHGYSKTAGGLLVRFEE